MALTPEQAAELLEQLSERLPERMAKLMLKAGTHVAGGIARAEKETQRPGDWIRTGALGRSFNPTFVKLGKKFGVGVYSTGAASRYAGIQDKGGVIFPKGRALAVPVGSARTIGKWPRDYGKDELDFVPREGKAPLLVHSQTGEVMFVLMSSVTIKARNYVALGWEKAKGDVKEIFADEFLTGVKGAFRGG